METKAAQFKALTAATIAARKEPTCCCGEDPAACVACIEAEASSPYAIAQANWGAVLAARPSRIKTYSNYPVR